ncbi:MAG: cellulase family glycosylhydrolase [Rhodospirillales bacterium]
MCRLFAGAPLAAAATALGAGFSSQRAAASAQGFVTTSGRQFLGADRQPLLLKGINLGNWLVPEGYMFGLAVATSPRAIYATFERLLGRDQSSAFWRRFRDTFIRREDIDFIAAAGFNTIRVPFHYNMFADDPGGQPGGGWALVDRLLAWCEAAGVYVVLDMHAAPGGQTGTNHDDGPGLPLLFYVPALQDQTVAVWRAIAERYKDKTAVLGYELLNEPISWYYDVSYLNPKLEPFYRRLVTEVRAVDQHHVIFLGGAQWNSNFSVLGPPFASNLAYTYHTFWAPTTRRALRSYLNFSYLSDAPIFLGEAGEADDDWVKAFRELHERLGIGWCFWTYKNMTSNAAVALVPRPADWDRVVALADGRGIAGAEAPRVAAALAEYLENIKLENTTIRRGYLQALGLRVPV